jgi:hypothetical protein
MIDALLGLRAWAKCNIIRGCRSQAVVIGETYKNKRIGMLGMCCRCKVIVNKQLMFYCAEDICQIEITDIRTWLSSRQV